jgi:hypothetical protein
MATTGTMTFLAKSLLNLWFGGTAYTFPGTMYMGLWNVDPAYPAGTGGTEVTGTGYGRATLAASTTTFPATTTSTISNNVSIPLTAFSAGGTWTQAISVILHDAVTAGNMLFWGDLAAPKTLTNGDTLSFGIGNFSVTLN